MKEEKKGQAGVPQSSGCNQKIEDTRAVTTASITYEHGCTCSI